MTAASHERFNPFPGLRPFEQHEDYLFFGREAQCHDLLRRLRRTRFLAVVGTSGSGKSSLVRAGLLPALAGGFMMQAGSNWRVAPFRPGNNPIAELALALSQAEIFGFEEDDKPQAAVQQAIIETSLRRSTLGLVEVVRQARLPEGEHLLVVVDQFEELFRFKNTSKDPQSTEDAAAFVKLLLEASRTQSPSIFIVLTMRSDFLGDCAQFRDLPEAINDGQFLIPRLTRDQRRQAIEGPVAVGGARMTPRLLQRLLNDVGDNPDQLPILQHALMRTWDHWRETQKDEELDLPHYEAIGGMAKALSNHADEIYTDLPDQCSRTIAETIFKRLTDKGLDNRGSRRPTPLAELCAVSSATEAEVIAVIEAFRQPGRSLLVPPAGIPLKAESVVDISHESLMRIWERLRAWVEEEARAARGYRRLAETAVLYKAGQAGLWRDPDLQLALNWHEQQHPNTAWAVRYHPAFEAAMQFLENSREAREAERARQEAEDQRELEQARALAQEAEARRKAEEEARRAAEDRTAEQARATQRFRRLALLLGVVFMLAVGAAGVALIQQQKAQENEKKAQKNERIAEERRIEAERRSFISVAQSLVAYAHQDNLQGDRERAALLARQAYFLNQQYQGDVIEQIDEVLRTILHLPENEQSLDIDTLVAQVCQKVKIMVALTQEEWKELVGPDIPYKLCEPQATSRIHLRDRGMTTTDLRALSLNLRDNGRPTQYVDNEFEDRGEVIVDHAIGLMWQKSGSEKWLIYEDALKYVEDLNRRNFAGYSDWRLPTIPELMSLLKPGEESNGLFIDPRFDHTQQWVWSADIYSQIKGEGSAGPVWLVSFRFGYVSWDSVRSDGYVRCVRP